MIDSIISSKTRIKLLLKFFLTEGTAGYLRGLSAEFRESSNGIRIELKRLTEAGLLTTFADGNKRMYQANSAHPLYEQIHQIVRKHIGLDQIVDTVVRQLGDLEQVYLTGSFSEGIDSGIIDLLFVGEIDKVYLFKLLEKVESTVNRKVRFVVYTAADVTAGALETFTPRPLLLWDKSSSEA